ncbi:tetratricopeptide (TPR) repeat protein [Nocardiopsis arvandica]|uniref:Tetratricopeptide (TPR) repeat protein n=1 Tax=Nocardiopsis sinuspersici TaxID=501010 RepID=A0A7Y9XHC8_9ACTN|nr:tetratricopeptide repeat protein [Nocardiopsis sinuspersici]NYH54685.1 tetratricopeptide (TPR) repeat protein [Nocardiopsis sinuspersici]
MTTTSGPPARSGPADPPSATDPQDTAEPAAPSGRDASGLCDQAQDLAENGHLARAAKLYRQAVAANPHPHVQARALLGLAVVEDQRGDPPAAREAARRALATGDSRYAPRAAHHLALSLEQDGEAAEAEHVWRRLLDLGGPAHTAVAHYGLARAAEERGDTDGAEEHWEAALTLPPDPDAVSRLHAATVADASRDLAGRLLGRGLPGAAAAAVERGLSVVDDPGLRLLRAAAHLEHAIADAGAVVDSEGGTGETAAAVELLAGLLALRGDPAAAERAWRLGLGGRDQDTAEEVRRRLRRGFATPEEEGGEAGLPWWEPYLEEAVATASAPALAGELFAVITRMHALLAVPVVEGESRPGALRTAMEQAVRTPSELVWGPGVHADFRRRLSEATGGRDVLPEGWPENGG